MVLQKKCKYCGKKFETWKTNKIYCSKECAKKGTLKKQRDKYRNDEEYRNRCKQRYVKRTKRIINELNKQYNGDLNELLVNIPSRWQKREAIIQSLFGESYVEAMYQKGKQTLKCELTGATKDLEIHHLYSFNTHPELSTDQANMVRITKQLHQIFHRIFGYGNNTPEQFENFINSITCKYCGKIFIPNMKGGKQKYCGYECAKKANQDKTSRRNSHKWYTDIEFRKRQRLGTITIAKNEDGDWEKELKRIRALKKQVGIN